MDVKPLTISFKKNDEDRELFNWIVTHSNFSGFVKDVLRAAMGANTTTIAATVIKKNENEDLIDLGDF